MTDCLDLYDALSESDRGVFHTWVTGIVRCRVAPEDYPAVKKAIRKGVERAGKIEKPTGWCPKVWERSMGPLTKLRWSGAADCAAREVRKLGLPKWADPREVAAEAFAPVLAEMVREERGQHERPYHEAEKRLRRARVTPDVARAAAEGAMEINATGSWKGKAK